MNAKESRVVLQKINNCADKVKQLYRMERALIALGDYVNFSKNRSNKRLKTLTGAVRVLSKVGGDSKTGVGVCQTVCSGKKALVSKINLSIIEK